MSSLKISISGVRGIVGESLGPELALDFGLAFGTYCRGGKVIVGRDSRVTGPMLHMAVTAGLTAGGCEVVDLGIVPTPTVQILVRQMGAAGGVIITASHNPVQWNGIKFVRDDGIFLNEDQAGQLVDLYYRKRKSGAGNEGGMSLSEMSYRDYTGIGSVVVYEHAAQDHIDKVLQHVNSAAIRARGFKVAIDVCNGAGYYILPELLRQLGCSVHVLNSEPTGLFNHNPEPVPQNLQQLSSVMREADFDIGFAVDADADRLAILDEAGRPIGEDYTLTLVTDYLLSTVKGGMVVTNLSTTRCIEDVAERYGAEVVRTKIGEVNVSEVLKDRKATVGGEGNGGVMVPAIGFGRDTVTGIAYILEMMMVRGLSVSSLVASLPGYVMVKDKLSLTPEVDMQRVLQNVKKKFASDTIDEQDGVKVIFPDSWVHVRPSNTEPIVRIIAEHPSEQGAQALVQNIKELF